MIYVDKGLQGGTNTIYDIGKKPILLIYVNLLTIILCTHKLLSNSHNKFRWLNLLAHIRGYVSHTMYDKISRYLSSFKIEIDVNKEKSIWQTQKTDIYTIITSRLSSLNNITHCKNILTTGCNHNTPEYITQFLKLHNIEQTRLSCITQSILTTTQGILKEILLTYNRLY